MNFNEYYWHDAIIKNIQIERNNPGVKDTILLEIEWPENKEKSSPWFVAHETITNCSVVKDQ